MARAALEADQRGALLHDARRAGRPLRSAVKFAVRAIVRELGRWLKRTDRDAKSPQPTLWTCIAQRNVPEPDRRQRSVSPAPVG